MSTTTCPYVLDVERVEKCTFRSHFPRCIFSRNAEFPLAIYTCFQILIVSERMSSDVDPPRWLRCSVVSRMRRIPKGYSDTPGCIKFCNVINACLTSRIPVIRRIDKCLKFLFFLSLYVKSGHRTF